MRRAIAISEGIDREFPLSASLTNETRGSTFTPSLIRGFYLVLGSALLKVFPLGMCLRIEARAETTNRSAFGLDEIKQIAEKVLKSLADYPIGFPISQPPPVGTPAPAISHAKYQSHFGTYHYAGAYMLYHL
jgi:hypothetical protein